MPRISNIIIIINQWLNHQSRKWFHFVVYGLGGMVVAWDQITNWFSSGGTVVERLARPPRPAEVPSLSPGCHQTVTNFANSWKHTRVRCAFKRTNSHLLTNIYLPSFIAAPLCKMNIVPAPHTTLPGCYKTCSEALAGDTLPSGQSSAATMFRVVALVLLAAVSSKMRAMITAAHATFDSSPSTSNILVPPQASSASSWPSRRLWLCSPVRCWTLPVRCLMVWIATTLRGSGRRLGKDWNGSGWERLGAITARIPWVASSVLNSTPPAEP